MQANFVLTLTGPDGIGVVEKVTGLLFERGGNVETSRMARLGGEFAVLMLVSMPAEAFTNLDDSLKVLTAQGYKVTTTHTQSTYARAHAGWRAYRIEVHGADHEGIIHGVARYLSDRGINIESADSESVLAPTSGAPLFAMTAHVLVPPGISDQGWEAGLEEIGNRLNLDITVTPA